MSLFFSVVRFLSSGNGGWVPDHLHLTITAACMETGAVRVDIKVRTGPHTEQVQD